MFCTSCGNPIAPEQAVCSKCGSPTAIGIMYGGVRRVADHIQLLGILHIVYSALICIPGLIMVILGKVFFGWFLQFVPQHGAPPPPFVGMIVAFVGWIMLIRGVIGIVAGVGLLQRAPWGRILALIMGFISLISFPFGTALGIYTIWVLLAAGAEHEYERLTLQPR
jgi:hypothetical protein